MENTIDPSGSDLGCRLELPKLRSIHAATRKSNYTLDRLRSNEAAGTLNLLEAMRQAFPEAPLVHLSHQQGLRRRTQSNPDEGIADLLGLRRSIVRGGHHGRFPNRSIKALSIRCLESFGDVLVQEYVRDFRSLH